MNHNRVERIWRREGLKVPAKRPKLGRLWINDGSCIRLRAAWPNHVWSYDFVMDRTHDGRAFRMLIVIDEFTRECLVIPVAAVLQAYRITQSASSLRVAISLAVSRLSSASDPSSGGVSTKAGSATPFNSPVTRMAW